ncbi:MAG: hypothetical protein IIC87_06420, partial [Chloroflexi bacterium]|nr:hypothetical protein [Chloroflexota bacterium]
QLAAGRRQTPTSVGPRIAEAQKRVDNAQAQLTELAPNTPEHRAAQTKVGQAEQSLATLRGKSQERVSTGARIGRTPLSEGQQLAHLKQRLGIAESELRQLQDAAKDFPRIRAVDRLEPISERTRTELTAATKEHEAAKAKYTREIEKARKAELAPGDLFGRAEDVIPIQVWRNRFFPLEDAKALREGLDTFLGGSDVSPWIRGIEQAANHIRFLSAIGDMAAPFTHGPLLAANSPSAWAKATLASYKAWLDPTVQARFIVDHRDTILEMAQHNVPIGDVEMFRVLQEGGGLSPGQMLEVLPRGGEIRGLFQGAGKQTFGRFQSAYDVFLLESRTLVWEGMKPNWQGTTAEMAEHVRNISGGLDSRALVRRTILGCLG